VVDLNMPEYANLSTLEKNLSISGGDQGMKTETDYLTIWLDYSADDIDDANDDNMPLDVDDQVSDYILFHDAHEDMVPGEGHYFDAYEDRLSGEGHYFDLSNLNKNEAFGFTGRDADDNGLVGVATPKGKDEEDNLFNSYIVTNTNVDTSKRGGPKDVKSHNRGDDVSPCPLESWTRHCMLGMQPIYHMVRYGMRKTLVKWPGSSDWIKCYL
jgi:hypothetical protein